MGSSAASSAIGLDAMIRLELPFPPTANLYWRVFRGRPVKSAEARAYQLRAKTIAISQRIRPIPDLVSLSVTLFRPSRRLDLDNGLKIVIDAMNGIAWNDDSQIVEIHALRLDDPSNPRILMLIDKWKPDNK